MTGVDLQAWDPARPTERASPWLWLLALVPAVAWFVHLNVSYLFVPVACRHTGRWLLAVLSMPPLVVIGAVMWLCWRAWHAERRAGTDRSAGAVGFWMGGLFWLVSLTILAANVVVDPCIP